MLSEEASSLHLYGVVFLDDAIQQLHDETDPCLLLPGFQVTSLVGTFQCTSSCTHMFLISIKSIFFVRDHPSAESEKRPHSE